MNTTARPIAEQIISAPENLSAGHHVNVTVAENIRLAPDTTLPYVVVALDHDGTTSTVYFRKWLLGVIVHGYDLSARGNFFGTPSWMSEMGNDLRSIDRYDSVFAYNWERLCALPQQGTVKEAARLLVEQLVSRAPSSRLHTGDVTDLHFIGHSRGAVVVGESLQLLAASKSENFKGSYVEITLLDPHPSNNALYLADGDYFVSEYRAFQQASVDPDVILPNTPMIRDVDIWYQKTPARQFDATSLSSFLNLWGLARGEPGLTNLSGVPIVWHDLTSKSGEAGIGLIGHSGVHEYYRAHVVDQGTLNRSKPTSPDSH